VANFTTLDGCRAQRCDAVEHEGESELELVAGEPIRSGRRVVEDPRLEGGAEGRKLFGVDQRADPLGPEAGARGVGVLLGKHGLATDVAVDEQECGRGLLALQSGSAPRAQAVIHPPQ
jgi:hypothetical protein